jgi:hypothetical protein
VKAGTESAAKKLFYRALDDYLAEKVERKHEGKQVIFRLREELVDTGEDVTRVTYPQGSTSDNPCAVTDVTHVTGVASDPSQRVTRVTKPLSMSLVTGDPPSKKPLSTCPHDGDDGQDWRWDWLASDAPILPDLLVPENPLRTNLADRPNPTPTSASSKAKGSP